MVMFEKLRVDEHPYIWMFVSLLLFAGGAVCVRTISAGARTMAVHRALASDTVPPIVQVSPSSAAPSAAAPAPLTDRDLDYGFFNVPPWPSDSEVSSCESGRLSFDRGRSRGTKGWPITLEKSVTADFDGDNRPEVASM